MLIVPEITTALLSQAVSDANIHMRNPSAVGAKITQIRADGVDKLHVISGT